MSFVDEEANTVDLSSVLQIKELSTVVNCHETEACLRQGEAKVEDEACLRQGEANNLLNKNKQIGIIVSNRIMENTTTNTDLTITELLNKATKVKKESNKLDEQIEDAQVELNKINKEIDSIEDPIIEKRTKIESYISTQQLENEKKVSILNELNFTLVEKSEYLDFINNAQDSLDEFLNSINNPLNYYGKSRGGLFLMKKIKLISLLLLIPLLIIAPISSNNNNKKCDYTKGTWLDIPLSIITSAPGGDRLYDDYGNIYVLIKSNKLLNIIDLEESSCHKKYAWYENGLSLNFVNEETKSLVFKNKVDNKYWLDISKPEARNYFLNQFKELRKEHNNVIHLDDHFAIPSVYGDYRQEINSLAHEVYKIGGKFSLSVLPQQYALTKYNQDWEYFLQQGYLSEIILQNYVEKNFDKNLAGFRETVERYNVNYSIGIYAGEVGRPRDINKWVESLKSKNIKYRVFPFRSVLFNR